MRTPAEQTEPGELSMSEYLVSLRMIADRLHAKAWSVSLHPDGKSYAATGGSGCITIHSAEPSSFGQRLSKLECSGRSKFGMFTTHVSPAFLPQGHWTAIDILLCYRALMVKESHFLPSLGKYTSSIYPQIHSLRHTHLTP